jgi:membrane protein YqaA with SNARE-associated domain
VILYYVIVFIAAFLVDLVPFVGPPAWTVMVFLQMKYGLNVWAVLVTGVIGSALGRYMLSLYIPWLSVRFIKVQKNEDLKFIGQKLAGNGWRIQLFVLVYTLMPLPSTPLFTASGIARIPPLHIIPAFLVGKFTSDMIMVLTGDFVANNAQNILKGFLTWQSVTGTILGIVIICVFLFIDWRLLLQQKKFRLNFRIWK